MADDIVKRLWHTSAYLRTTEEADISEAIEDAVDEVERLRAEVERVEGQRKLRADLAYLMKSEKDDALAEVMRLRAAGDALAEEVRPGERDVLRQWEEARRER